MPITYDITTDLRYLQGFEIGFQKGIEMYKAKRLEEQALLIAENLLKTKRLSDEEVASFSFLPIEKVLELKMKLEL